MKIRGSDLINARVKTLIEHYHAVKGEKVEGETVEYILTDKNSAFHEIVSQPLQTLVAFDIVLGTGFTIEEYTFEEANDIAQSMFILTEAFAELGVPVNA